MHVLLVYINGIDSFLPFCLKECTLQPISVSSNCYITCSGGLPYILPVHSLSDGLPRCLHLPDSTNNAALNILRYILL